MRPLATRLVALAAGVAALNAGALLAGCGEHDYVYPFYELLEDTETETETVEEDSETGTESETESVDIECPADFLDDLGRCIRYVDWDAEETVCGTGWNGAFKRIQDGIASAYEAALQLGECEVWVAAGTYRSFEGDPADAIELRPMVRVYGGFAGVETLLEERDVGANETILEGRDESGAQASYHVVRAADHSELDGFTIRGGDARGPSPNHRGGGLYSNSAHVAIRNCRFEDNRAVEGGAAFLYDAVPIVERCAFEGNAADHGGAIFVLNGTAQIADVVVEGNVAYRGGGGIYLQSVFGDCHPTLAAVRVSGNRSDRDGGGVYVENCSPSFADSKIEDNAAMRDGGGLFGFHGGARLAGSTLMRNTALGDGGGAASWGSRLELFGAVVARNTARGSGGGLRVTSWGGSVVRSTLVSANEAGGEGGGVYAVLDEPAFVDTRITGNRAARGGGAFNARRALATYLNTVFHGNLGPGGGDALYNADDSEVEVLNTIAYGNGVMEILDEKEAATEVRFCDVRGGYPGAFNIDADPLFAAPGAWDGDAWVDGDYHLRPESPCIDQANQGVSPDADADGNAWEDVDGAGLPDVSTDIGAYDWQG